MRTKTILYALIPVALIAGAAAYHLSQKNAELNHQAKVKAEGLLAVTLVPVEEHAFRPAVQGDDVLREDGQKRHRAAKQHGKHVQRDGAEDDFVLVDEIEPGVPV